MACNHVLFNLNFKPLSEIEMCISCSYSVPCISCTGHTVSNRFVRKLSSFFFFLFHSIHYSQDHVLALIVVCVDNVETKRQQSFGRTEVQNGH